VLQFQPQLQEHPHWGAGDVDVETATPKALASTLAADGAWSCKLKKKPIRNNAANTGFFRIGFLAS
jgi:hypothetical protein